MEAQQDYSMFEEETPDLKLQELAEIAELQLAAEDALEDAERLVERRKKELAAIAEKQLPELMDELKISEFKLSSGRKIKVSEKIRASIAKKNKPLAFEWVRKQGSGKMIKRVVSLPFSTGEDEKADKLIKKLTKQGYEPGDKQDIHNATLVAFVRRRLEAGEELPLDLFGVFRQRVAEISS